MNTSRVRLPGLRVFTPTLLIFSCIFYASIDAGMDKNTTVQTPKGPQELGVLKVGDKVICLNKKLIPKEKEVTAIKDEEEEEATEITTEDNVVIYTSKGQRVFIPQKKKWVKVYKLKPGEALLKKDGSEIKIKDIKKKFDKRIIRYITVDKHHNFFAGENGVLVHNFALAIPILTWGAGAAATWFEGVTLAGVASAVAGLIVREAIAVGVEEATGKDIRGIMGAAESAYDGTSRGRQQGGGGCRSTPADTNGGVIFSEKAPGVPTANDGYTPPKRYEGGKVPNPNGPGYGYPDKSGNVWVPTGVNGHGAPHWDVQDPKTGKHTNIMPGGHERGKKNG